MFLLLVGVAFAFAFSSTTSTGGYSNSEQTLYGVTLLLSCLMVVLGFGLLLGYYGQNLMTGIFSALFTVSLTLLLSPLLQKLCLGVFLNGFKGLTADLAPTYLLYTASPNSQIGINYTNLKLALNCAISLLLVQLAMVGRLKVYTTLYSSLTLILGWNANYALCVSLMRRSADVRFFDDYSVGMVYLFGGVAALLISLDVKSPLRLKQSHKQKGYPRMVAYLGVFFMWMSFALTSPLLGTKQNTASPQAPLLPTTVFYPHGCIAIFFALSSATLTTAALSPPKIRLTDLMLGSLSGAIAFGPVASYVSNIAAPIAVGTGGALITVLYKVALWPRINKDYCHDALGSLGPIFGSALLGSALVSPLTIFAYERHSLSSNTAMDGEIDSKNSPYWMLIYAGVSLGVGLVTAMVTATIIRCADGN